MMRLNIAPAPWPGAPVVVLSAGLGGGGGYWLSAARGAGGTVSAGEL